MLIFFVVIAIQVHRNRRSTVAIVWKDKHFKKQEYWLLCNKLTPNSKLKLVAYFEKPGFNFGPYVWVTIETDDKGEVTSLVELPDEF